MDELQPVLEVKCAQGEQKRGDSCSLRHLGAAEHGSQCATAQQRGFWRGFWSLDQESEVLKWLGLHDV